MPVIAMTGAMLSIGQHQWGIGFSLPNLVQQQALKSVASRQVSVPGDHTEGAVEMLSSRQARCRAAV